MRYRIFVSSYTSGSYALSFVDSDDFVSERKNNKGVVVDTVNDDTRVINGALSATSVSGASLTATAGTVTVSTSTTSSASMCLAGAVASLPTSGYGKGCLAYLTSDNKVYVATQTVVGTFSWQAVGAQ